MSSTMGERDSYFRSNFILNNTQYIEKDNLKNFLYYRPDIILENQEEIIVLEHSSTGDRKVHIGELSQFIEFTLNYRSNKNFNLIIFLDGKGETAPQVKKECDRLKYYVERLFSDKLETVRFIGVVEYNIDMNGLSLNQIIEKSECVYIKEVEHEHVSYRECINISCSEIKNNIASDENFLQNIIDLFESEFNDEIGFDINPEQDLEGYTEYPVSAIGEVTITDISSISSNYLIFIERQTVNGNLILNLSIGITDDYVYKGINDCLYSLKTRVKNTLLKGFKKIYWQLDDHNNDICKDLYGRIHCLENEFRQLIIEFMVKSYGYKWSDKFNNEVLKNKIKKYSIWYKQNYTEFSGVYIDLFNLQVNDLIDFLNSVYESDDINEQVRIYFDDANVYNKLTQKGTNKIVETIKINLNDILNRNSVWNLYMIDILGDDFTLQWDKFEKMRNMVAHNKPICENLFNDFAEVEDILNNRFKDFKKYIKDNFDSKNKENIDILTNRKNIEIQHYEDMLREEAGLMSMPRNEDDVFEEINNHDSVIELNNIIEEYVETFKDLSEELIGLLEDIEYDEISNELEKTIIRDILCIEDIINQNEFKQNIVNFINELTNKCKEMFNDTGFRFGIIYKLYGLWDEWLEISVIGTLCIEEGNVDNLEVLLIQNTNLIEKGFIEKTYGEYYISDYGAAMPEIGDDLQINIEDLQKNIEQKFQYTVQKLNYYISLFEE